MQLQHIFFIFSGGKEGERDERRRGRKKREITDTELVVLKGAEIIHKGPSKRHLFGPFSVKIRQGGCLHSRKSLPLSAYAALGFLAEC